MTRWSRQQSRDDQILLGTGRAGRSRREHGKYLWIVAISVTALVSLIDGGAGLIVGGLLMLAVMLSVDIWRIAMIVTLLATFATSWHWPNIAEFGSQTRTIGLGVLAVLSWVEPKPRGAMKMVNTRVKNSTVLTSLLFASLVALVGSLWSVTRSTTFYQSIAFVLFVAFLYGLVFRRWVTRDAIIADLNTILIPSFVVSCASLVLFVVQDPHAMGVGSRFQGVFANPNQLSLSQGATFALAISLAVLTRRAFYLIVGTIPLCLILLSESRTGLLTVIVGLAALVVVSRRTVVQGVVWLAALSLGVGGFVVGFSMNRIGDIRAVERIQVDAATGDLFEGRTEIWTAATSLILERPIEGYGYGSTPTVLANQAEGLASTSSVHNGYLQSILEVGLLGGVALLVGLLAILRSVHQGLGRREQAGLIALVFMGLASQFTESSFIWVSQWYPFLFWPAVLALVVLNEENPSPMTTAGVPHVGSNWRRERAHNG